VHNSFPLLNYKTTCGNDNDAWIRKQPTWLWKVPHPGRSYQVITRSRCWTTKLRVGMIMTRELGNNLLDFGRCHIRAGVIKFYGIKLLQNSNVGMYAKSWHKLGNRCFENVKKFRHLGTTITNQNLIQEEIKRGLNSGNPCYHSVQNLLSSRLLYKNIINRI
jgi:hypothetical protein